MQQVFINGILEPGLQASIAQLGERQTEDLKVPRSIRGRGIFWLSSKISLAPHKALINFFLLKINACNKPLVDLKKTISF